VLLLFDIDGTLLLKASAEHRLALLDAIVEVWHVPDPAAVEVEAAGRTDLEIVREILLLSGINRDVEERFDDFRAAAVAAYARRCPPDLRGHVAPGVPAMLDAVAAAGHTSTLVTGNLEPIARIKLRAAGVGDRFPPGQGGYGSDHLDRNVLPGIARRRAARVAGLDDDWPRADTVVIGDTPRDIACAHADGVACVAVATGPYGADALTAADVVVTRAAEIPAALAALPARD
jgi:phosphoglycolate phosphatase-like HAD superfamily hydrolase